MRKANNSKVTPVAFESKATHRHPNGTMLFVALPWKLNKKRNAYWATIPDSWLSEANLKLKRAVQEAQAEADRLKAEFVQSAFGPQKIGAKVNVAIHKDSCGLTLDEREESREEPNPGIRF